MPNISAAYLTDKGLVRKMNQDSVVILSAEELDCRLDGLYIVADGMGGNAGGEIASRVTVETVPDVVQEILNEQTEGAGPKALAQALREALEAANDAVYTQARANPELRGMGTTCTAALIRDNQAIIGNVGDSRTYLFREGRLIQLTADHSLVQEHVRAGELTEEEARSSRFKNVITRAIGIARSVVPDVEVVNLLPGDTLLLCSDGLTNMVPEPQIAWLLSDEDVDKACHKLIDAAIKNGGKDNITTVVVRYGAYSASPVPEPIREIEEKPSILHRPPTPRRRRPESTPVLLAVIALLAVGLLYVGREVYQLVPGWPFIRHREAPRPEPVVPTQPPPPDYGRLTYGDPAVLLNRPVRAMPLVCDPAGNLLVVAADTGSVLRIAPEGTSVTFVASDIAPGTARADKHWTVDPQGNLYVSSYREKKIAKYDPRGARIGTLGDGKLKGPEAVAVDAKGNVYVVDGGRLKVFRATAPGQTPPAPVGSPAAEEPVNGRVRSGGNSRLSMEPVAPSSADRPNRPTNREAGSHGPR